MNNYSYVNINILCWCEKVKRECGFLEMFFAAFLFWKREYSKIDPVSVLPFCLWIAGSCVIIASNILFEALEKCLSAQNASCRDAAAPFSKRVFVHIGIITSRISSFGEHENIGKMPSAERQCQFGGIGRQFNVIYSSIAGWNRHQGIGDGICLY